MPGVNSVVDAVVKIGDYCVGWLERTIAGKRSSAKRLGLTGPGIGGAAFFAEEGVFFQPSAVSPGRTPGTIYLEKGVQAVGAAFYVDSGDIYIGANTVIEPGAGIKGPCIIGPDCEIRQGAYLRGNVITGAKGIFRGEIKNAVIMDDAHFLHPSYVGDSLCGWKTHFGNQATTANLGIYYHVGGTGNIEVDIEGARYDLGVTKLGIVHDTNCPFKAYRSEVVKNIWVYGNLYRFIPALAYWQGYRIAEIKVENDPRVHGDTKYGPMRWLGGFIDLLTRDELRGGGQSFKRHTGAGEFL